MTAGLKPAEYYECSLGEVIEMITGWQYRELMERRRIRELKYTIYCAVTETGKRVSMYEFEPLDDDPTPEEIQEMQKEQAEEEQREMQQAYDQYKKMGLI